jgi:hypothetical protein
VKVDGVTNPRKYILNQTEAGRRSPIASASMLPAPEATEEGQRQEEG